MIKVHIKISVMVIVLMSMKYGKMGIDLISRYTVILVIMKKATQNLLLDNVTPSIITQHKGFRTKRNRDESR